MMMHICNSSFKETGNKKRYAALEQWISMRLYVLYIYLRTEKISKIIP